jgi:hypothetical protein
LVFGIEIIIMNITSTFVSFPSGNPGYPKGCDCEIFMQVHLQILVMCRSNGNISDSVHAGHAIFTGLLFGIENVYVNIKCCF